MPQRKAKGAANKHNQENTRLHKVLCNVPKRRRIQHYHCTVACCTLWSSEGGQNKSPHLAICSLNLKELLWQCFCSCNIRNIGHEAFMWRPLLSENQAKNTHRHKVQWSLSKTGNWETTLHPNNVPALFHTSSSCELLRQHALLKAI